MAQLEMMNDAVLMGEQYVSLSSYRKNGNEVSTPVWFAQAEDKIYILTMKGSGKTRRIRNNGHVRLTPCNARGIRHGKTINGMASLHAADSPIGKQAYTALRKKYGFTIRFFEFMWWIRGNEKLFIEISLK